MLEQKVRTEGIYPIKVENDRGTNPFIGASKKRPQHLGTVPLHSLPSIAHYQERLTCVAEQDTKIAAYELTVICPPGGNALLRG